MFGRRELVKKSEAAKFLGIKDVRTLNKAIASGKIKMTILGDGSARIHKGQILNFVHTDY